MLYFHMLPNTLSSRNWLTYCFIWLNIKCLIFYLPFTTNIIYLLLLIFRNSCCQIYHVIIHFNWVIHVLWIFLWCIGNIHIRQFTFAASFLLLLFK